MKPISVCIVDDHALLRDGLKYLLAKDPRFGPVFEASGGEAFLKMLGNTRPDVALMDIAMPDMNGIETTRQALELQPGLKVIALSMYADECHYRDMIEAGACGFLLKNSRIDDVQKAIDEVVNGRNYFSPEILSSLVRNLNYHRHHDTHELTKRECEVLLYICQGHSNAEIADFLYISKRTVDKHRENILLKSQSKNTAELVVFAIRNGYFDV